MGEGVAGGLTALAEPFAFEGRRSSGAWPTAGSRVWPAFPLGGAARRSSSSTAATRGRVASTSRVPSARSTTTCGSLRPFEWGPPDPLLAEPLPTAPLPPETLPTEGTGWAGSGRATSSGASAWVMPTRPAWWSRRDGPLGASTSSGRRGPAAHTAAHPSKRPGQTTPQPEQVQEPSPATIGRSQPDRICGPNAWHQPTVCDPRHRIVRGEPAVHFRAKVSYPNSPHTWGVVDTTQSAG